MLFLLVSLLGVVQAAPELDSGAWNDLTNNFATDIAPLIALFGEQVTKQFLSESTGILDNIIFGMAPLGILTAVVSVIRVYGWPSMKSFIGRAQEAHGVAEAELCSSTSYDVCELWSEGGICRVFGRPKVLEFLYKPGRSDSRFYPKFSKDTTEKQVEEPGPCDLYRPACFFGACKPKTPSKDDKCAERDSDWEELRVKSPPNTTSETSSSLQFAPCPNLSLNIGIRVAPRWGLVGVAMFVSLVQLGFFAYAAVVTFARPDLYADGEGPPVWAFVLAVLGTAMLVSGMTLCAFLIERRSTERCFKHKALSPKGRAFQIRIPTTLRYWRRTKTPVKPVLDPKSSSGADTTIYWLQPGGQLIGDQQFNAFAYNIVKHNYITSFKTDQSHHWDSLQYSMNFVLLLALFASVVGFVLQFIGLRSLHGSVTLYQTAATLFAAMIRALLRQRHLNPDDNKLQDFKAKFESNELDWQAKTIFSAHLSRSSAPNSLGDAKPLVEMVDHWQICDERYTSPGNFVFADNKSVRRIASGKPHGSNQPCLYGFFKNVGDPAVVDKSWDQSHICATESVEFARRYEMTEEGGPPNWAASIVLLRSRLAFMTGEGMTGVQPRWDSPVRSVAHELQLAIQGLANYVFSGKVPLRAVDDPSEKGSWQNVSAITWNTTVSMNLKRPGKPFPERKEQIISIPMFLFEGEWKISKHILEAILSLWASSLEAEDEDGLNDKVLISLDEMQQRRMLSTFELWVPAGNLKPWKGENHGNRRKWTEAWQVEERRVFLKDRDAHEGAAHYGWHLVAMRAKSSRNRLLAQNILTIFVSRLADIIQRIELSDKDLLAAWGLRDAGTLDPTRDIGPGEEFGGLANTHINFITKLIVQSGLGTEEEALMCILPVFDQAGILPREDDILTRILRWTQKLRRKKDFVMAEKALKVALGNSSRRELIHGVGELYRKAYMAGRQEWALEGLVKMSRFGGVRAVGGRDSGGAGSSEPTASGWPMHRRFMSDELDVFKQYRDLEGALRSSDERCDAESLESQLSTSPVQGGASRVEVLALAAKTDLAILDEERLKGILELAIRYPCMEVVEDALETHVGIREHFLQGGPSLNAEVVNIAKEIRADIS